MEAAAKQKKQVKQTANTRGLFTTKNMVLMAMLGALSRRHFISWISAMCPCLSDLLPWARLPVR